MVLILVIISIITLYRVSVFIHSSIHISESNETLKFNFKVQDKLIVNLTIRLDIFRYSLKEILTTSSSVLYCRSLWMKASGKCMNVNINECHCMLFTSTLHQLLWHKQNKTERQRWIIWIICYAESLSSPSVWTQMPSRNPKQLRSNFNYLVVYIHAC